MKGAAVCRMIRLKFWRPVASLGASPEGLERFGVGEIEGSVLGIKIPGRLAGALCRAVAG